MKMTEAPMEGHHLWDEVSGEWVPVQLDAYGFPATDERKEQLRAYRNWVWSDEVGEWVPPTPRPDDVSSPLNSDWIDYRYEWDDDAAEWVAKSTAPFPSWTRNNDGYWVAPIQRPVDVRNVDGSIAYSWTWDEPSCSWVETPLT